MTDPVPKNDAKMALGHRNHVVQTLATDSADQALAEGIRLWNESRSLENLQPHRLKGSIDAFHVNRVAIGDHKSVPLIAWHNQPKLLRRPVRCRMLRYGPQRTSAFGFTGDDDEEDEVEFEPERF